jgi:hypothetical protein
MSAGALIIFLVVFPWYVWLTWREEKNITVKYLFMVIACLVVALPTTLLNMSVQQSYEGDSIPISTSRRLSIITREIEIMLKPWFITIWYPTPG